jgi:V-type H+-transporting ATPase subunit a
MNDVVAESGLDTTPIVNKLKSRLTPPSYIPVNKFTSGFQALVNTYGTPRYREANPGAFCVILFPYLFGIMFGDFGHGLMLAALGYYFISKEKEWDGKPLSDMLEMIYGGRYILLLNGLFGAFTGIMYNEAFAFPMAWFGPTHWKAIGGGECEGEGCEVVGGNYPVGVDPLWHYCQNSVKISFFNSLKMKISIVVGVIQMSLGIFISLLNHLEYRDYKKVFFQFIPEWIFFQGIFGYLIFTIFLKWATDWNDPANPQPAPSLLTMLINMFMSPTSAISEPLYGGICYGGDPSRGGGGDCAAAARDNYCGIETILAACPVTCGNQNADEFHDQLRMADPDFGIGEFKICFSPLQSQIQFSLLIAAFVAVPFLLLPIPFIEMYTHARAQKAYAELGEEAEGGGHGGHDGEEFSLGDAFIHQGIHTIEFVLGSISNTASYLRLWALSLAHTQLAELFMDMILTQRGLMGNKTMSEAMFGMAPGSVPSLVVHVLMLFLTYGVWALCTFVVLMVMENLSSFLHALRLQWVEFQNKFFYGDGQRFAPFTFKLIGAQVSADDE